MKLKFKNTIDGQGIVGTDHVFTRVLEAACKFAQHDINVLIVGEAGTGRNTIARLIHEIRRPGEPFYEADCRLSDRFIKAELLGQPLMRCGGDVVRTEPDPAEVRHTLLLRDVHHVGPCFGNDLASFLREGKLGTVGFGKVCVIATADKDEGNICREAEGLNPFLRHFEAVLKVPSLDERRGDIAPLAKAFLGAWNAQNGRKLRFAGNALQRLQRRPWPGNLVELRRAVEMAAMICEGMTIRDDMIEPAEGEEPEVAPAGGFVLGSMKLDKHLKGLKRGWVRDALARCEGKKSAAADLLGWSPQRMHKYLATESAEGHSF
jgi:DNA-binding NtrC family response regulator